MDLCKECHRLGHKVVHPDQKRYCKKLWSRSRVCQRCGVGNARPSRMRAFFQCDCYDFRERRAG